MKYFSVVLGSTLALAVILLATPVAMAGSCGACTECDDPQGFDVVICGCFDGQPGSVGADVVRANAGDQIFLPIRLTANNTIDALAFDLEYPDHLLAYVSTSADSLTTNWTTFSGNPHPTEPFVRVGAFEVGADVIDPGQTGPIALLQFTVLPGASGCGSFCFLQLFDDIASYLPCDAGTATPVGADGVDIQTWGSVKTRYRD